MGGDAGLDGGETDAHVGRDAGVARDAGTGWDAAYLPPAVVTAATATEVKANEVEQQLDSVPMSDLQQEPVLDIELCVIGINGLIGETGIQTLGLSAGATRALADYQLAVRLLGLLDAAIADLPTVGTSAEVLALRTAAIELRAQFASYRDELLALYQMRRVDEPLVAPTTISTHVAAHSLLVNIGQSARLVMVSDNPLAPVAGTNASLSWDCLSLGTVTVYDFESGAVIVATRTGTTGNVVMQIGPAVVPLEIVAAPMLADPALCSFTLTGTRVLGAAPRNLATTTLSSEALSFDNTGRVFASTAQSLGVDPIVDSVRRQVALLHDVLAPLVGGATRSVPVEDVDRALRLHRYVDAMMGALLTSAQLTSVTYDGLRNVLSTLRTQAQQITRTAAAAP